MTHIDELYGMLNWNQPEYVQENGRKLAADVKHLSVFCRPLEEKSIWENCAKIMAAKKNEELSIYVYELLEWLKDMNWPGYSIIFSRVCKMSNDVLEPAVELCIQKADLLHDDDWYFNLKCLLERQAKNNEEEM